MLCNFLLPLTRFLACLLLLSSPVFSQEKDTTFGGGNTTFAFFGINPNGSNSTRAVKTFLLPDGKYLVVANYRYGSPKPPSTSNTTYLVRRVSTGEADGTQNGTIGSAGNFVATDAAMQPDGKIVVVGYSFQNPQQAQGQDWKIVRFNANGSLDATFGSGGVIVRTFGANLDFATNVELQADGKIVVSGYSINTSETTVTVVARYNSNGSPDLPFGPYGEGFFQSYDSGYLSKELVIQPDGKILLAGDSSNTLQPINVFLARFNSNGASDASFGNGGYVTLYYNSQIVLKDVELLQPNGKILVLLDSIFTASGTYNHIEQQSLLLRFNANGTKDSSFGTNGDVLINTSPPSVTNPNGVQLLGFETAQSIAVRSGGSGNILISGIRRELASSDGYMFSILEYSANGQFIGKIFSRRTRNNQLVRANITSTVNGSFEQPDGKIFLYGTLPQGGGASFSQAILIRYLSASAVNNANLFFDYDFDGADDLAMYSPNNSGPGKWLVQSLNPFIPVIQRDYGAAGDRIAPGDYDGDGIQDLAVFRPTTGEWITRKIYLDACAQMDCVETIQFGAAGDIPAPGDFDGDGKFDRAVFRPSGGDWYILFSSTGNYTGFHFGQSSDQPVVGDYDGDGKSDVAVIRRENGKIFWYILQSSDGAFVALQFGDAGDKTVVADYNGDGKSEIAVWRPSNGFWYVLTNYTNFSSGQFGAQGDIPEPADYDGDRKADFAVFRSQPGVHYILRSLTNDSVGVQFGASGDVPIASAYVR